MNTLDHECFEMIFIQRYNLPKFVQELLSIMCPDSKNTTSFQMETVKVSVTIIIPRKTIQSSALQKEGKKSTTPPVP